MRSLLLLPGAFLGLACASASRPAPLQLLNGTTCLDGSRGGYYHRQALNDTFATHWVFSLEGGGECVSEDDCKSRTEGDLGSSDGWPATGDSFLFQFQEDDASRNPDFYAWHHVFIKYCTGDLHLGTVQEPSEDQWGWAYFSGALIVDAVIADLQESADLNESDLIVWSGDSAGGIGSAGTLDHVAKLLPDTTRVVGAPIAGFYWNNSHPYTGAGAIDFIPFDDAGFKTYQALWQMRLPEACTAVYSEKPWLCAMLNFSIPTLESEIFVIEFETDSGAFLVLHPSLPPSLSPSLPSPRARALSPSRSLLTLHRCLPFPAFPAFTLSSVTHTAPPPPCSLCPVPLPCAPCPCASATLPALRGPRLLRCLR